MAAKKPDNLNLASNAVLVKSEPLDDYPEVEGIDFNQPFDLNTIFKFYKTTGFQATNLALAAETIEKMIHWRPSKQEIHKNPDLKEEKCTIFLGYTSNLISSGIRDIIRYLVQHKMVDVIVTTAGGIEEDLMKCMAPHFVGGRFDLCGESLRKKGHNRIGNLIVPNDNYCKFEDWFTPIIKKMHAEHQSGEVKWSPSKIIERLGFEIDDERSVCYWAAKNKIPIFCPALTDGSIGDMFFFQSYNLGDFCIDILQDIQKLNEIALTAHKTDKK